MSLRTKVLWLIVVVKSCHFHAEQIVKETFPLNVSKLFSVIKIEHETRKRKNVIIDLIFKVVGTNYSRRSFSKEINVLAPKS
jgi:hypothetical protein